MIKRYAGTNPARSRAVAHGGVVYTVATAKDKSGALYAQTKDALAQIDATLAEAGTSKSRILRTTVYITDMSKKPEMDRDWDEWVYKANAAGLPDSGNFSSCNDCIRYTWNSASETWTETYEGWTHGEIPGLVARRYLAELLVRGPEIDTLVLGCTHYPLLTGLIQLTMGDGVTLVTSAEETAKDVFRVLTATGRLRPEDAPPPRHRFVATGDPEPFRRLGRRFLGPEIDVVRTAVGSAVPA